MDTLFRHPRRHYRLSRTPPTIVRAHLKRSHCARAARLSQAKAPKFRVKRAQPGTKTAQGAIHTPPGPGPCWRTPLTLITPCLAARVAGLEQRELLGALSLNDDVDGRAERDTHRQPNCHVVGRRSESCANSGTDCQPHTHIHIP